MVSLFTGSSKSHRIVFVDLKVGIVVGVVEGVVQTVSDWNLPTVDQKLGGLTLYTFEEVKKNLM